MEEKIEYEKKRGLWIKGLVDESAGHISKILNDLKTAMDSYKLSISKLNDLLPRLQYEHDFLHHYANVDGSLKDKERIYFPSNFPNRPTC